MYNNFLQCLRVSCERCSYWSLEDASISLGQMCNPPGYIVDLPSVITMCMLQGRNQSGSHTYKTGVSIKYTNSVKDQLNISRDNYKNTLYLIIDSLKVYGKPSIALSKCTLRRISMNLNTSLPAGRPYEQKGAMRKQAGQSHPEQK